MNKSQKSDLYDQINYAKGQELRREQRPSPKKRVVRKFFLTFFVTLVLLSTVGGLVLYGLAHNGDEGALAIARSIDSNLKTGGNLMNLFSNVKEHTNFVLMGTDEAGTRTDFMMVGSFNSKTKAIDIISMPRDTYVVMPQERRDILSGMGKWTPSEMKLTHVHHYAGNEIGTEFTIKQIEEILNIQIEYYALVDIESFRYIVDEIGGVEFDVPQRMYYRDPVQGLYIDLQPGVQVLNGADAEGLVRYRKSDAKNPISKGYANGDLQRVEVQQAFMKALISQLASKDNILKNASAVMSTLIKYVETNFDITDAGKFAQFLPDIKTQNINTYTLPGDSKTINGQSYFIHDPVETAALVEEIFFSSPDEIKEEDSFDKKIQILNGAGEVGLASKNRDFLEEKGYSVADIDDYFGKRTPETRIMVNKKGFGADIAALYKDSKIIVDRSIASDYDIVIILGTNETGEAGF